MTFFLHLNSFRQTKYSGPLIHFGAWFAFIFYEIFAAFFFAGSYPRLGITLVYYILYIGLFYLHANLVLPYLFRKPNGGLWLRLCLLLLAEISCCLAVKFLIDYYIALYRLPATNGLNVSRYLFLGIWRDLYFLTLSSVYWLVRRVFNYREEINAAEKRELIASTEKAVLEKEMAELNFAFLQQQINPHFLFNTLNFIYSSVLKISPAAAKSVLQLSELIRYGFQSQDGTAKKLLQDEEEQIRNMVELNRARFGDRIYVEYEASGAFQNATILPLVLLTFTENLFKHGNLRDADHPARIEITVQPVHLLKFVTWNLKKHPGDSPSAKGIGLANAVKRLNFAYGDRYLLELTDRHDSFGLELKITL